jgi:hypothetical protein
MIVDMIYGQLIKDPDIYPQIMQINVLANSGVVTLEGWVCDEVRYASVLSITNNTTCVIGVYADNFYDDEENPTRPGPAGCNPSPPLYPCGDICTAERCNLAIGD